MTISQDSIYYETDGHVADDVTCRKWWLFKETHVARIPVRLYRLVSCRASKTLLAHSNEPIQPCGVRRPSIWLSVRPAVRPSVYKLLRKSLFG